MSTVKIPLTRGGATLVDADIAARLQGRPVFLSGVRYPSVSINSKTVAIHRLVIAPRPGLEVDHINGDQRDNRRANLRSVTHSENILNCHKRRKSRSSYRSVHWLAHRRVWKIRIGRGRRDRCFGADWRSRHVAALFADRTRDRLIGSFAAKNFAETITPNRVCRFIAETNGRIFRVVFSKRSDGTQRVMTCRTGVKSNSSGAASGYCPCLCSLATVWDVHKRAYRSIPVERIVCIKFAKVNYRIEGNHENIHAKTRRAA